MQSSITSTLNIISKLPLEFPPKLSDARQNIATEDGYLKGGCVHCWWHVCPLHLVNTDYIPAHTVIGPHRDTHCGWPSGCPDQSPAPHCNLRLRTTICTAISQGVAKYALPHILRKRDLQCSKSLLKVTFELVDKHCVPWHLIRKPYKCLDPPCCHSSQALQRCENVSSVVWLTQYLLKVCAKGGKLRSKMWPSLGLLWSSYKGRKDLSYDGCC